MKYYEEILADIEDKVNRKEYDAALFKIKEELAMPYIPKEFEEKLILLKRDIQYAISDKQQNNEIPIDKVLHMLKGNDKSQLRAVELLENRNLRDFIVEIKDFLEKDPCPEAASLMIELLAQQEIKDEFIVIKNGLEYTFYGDSVIPVAQSEGFLSAISFLSEWVENDYPALYGMCRSLLIHKCYMALPINYEKEDGYSLAVEVIDELSDILEDDTSFIEIKNKIKEMN